MEKTFQIGEIARFFDLAPSTLRYWEECGILAPDKNKENQYRTYSVSDLMAISDAVFYKSLGLPLKQIRDMEQTTPGQHRELLEEKMGELVALQEQVQLRMEKLRFHLAAIDEVERLRKRPYAIEEIDTECIVSFDLIEQDKLRQYIGNPYLYSRVQHSCCLQQEHRGLTVPAEQLDQFPPEQILWQNCGGTYAACLMREEHTQPYKNNLQQQLAYIQKSYRTGAVISRFLLCAREDGELYDFYKTFVEVFPKEWDGQAESQYSIFLKEN